MKKSLTFWNLFPWLLITCGILLLIFRLWLKNRTNQIQDAEVVEEDQTTDETQETDDEPTREQRIRNHYAIIRRNLDESSYSNEFVKMLTAVSMHETGVFTSNIYLENNNLFGMKLPTIRETLAKGENRGHATFASLDDSVKDLELYFKEFSYKTSYPSVKELVGAMKKAGYFTAPVTTYGNAVSKHYSTVRSIIQ